MDTTPITIIKVSGKELDDPTFLNNLCTTIAGINTPIILVHGGGKEISTAMEKFGQPIEFVEGLRVTPPESMTVMEMVVCGSINKRIVARLVAAGKKALGMSGIDLGLLRCVPLRPNGIDLGRVGDVTQVDTCLLHSMLAMGWLPVIAPVALEEQENLPYNVNADHIAQSIAAAIATDQTPSELVFVSNVPGVIIKNEIVPLMTHQDIDDGIAQGAITDGMIPKVRSALNALQAGVASVRITNLEGLAHGGTRIIEHSTTNAIR